MRGLKLNYVSEGEGKVILFIHGLSDNLMYWEVLTNSLKKDYNVIRVDLRGHGETPLGDDDVTIEIYADDVKKLLDELNIGKVNIVGFSLGGAVAQLFAVKYPEMLSSLVLMSTISKCDEYLKIEFAKFKSHLLNGFEDFYDYMIPKVLCPDVIENNKEELELLKQLAATSANVEAYIKAVEACLDFDVEDKLSEIDVSALILAGEYDDIFPLKYQKNLKDKIKNSELIVFPDTKHNLLVGKNNGEILNILNNFYKK